MIDERIKIDLYAPGEELERPRKWYILAKELIDDILSEEILQLIGNFLKSHECESLEELAESYGKSSSDVIESLIKPHIKHEIYKKGMLVFPYIVRLKSILPKNHWLGDILKVMYDGDYQAAERLVNNFYSFRTVFAGGRRLIYESLMKDRIHESGANIDFKQTWNDIAISALMLSLKFSINSDSREAREKIFIGTYLLFRLINASLLDDESLPQEENIVSSQKMGVELR